MSECKDRKEIWKDVEGYEGIYQVSNLGRVRSFYNGSHGIGDKSKILKQAIDTGGRSRVSLSRNGEKIDMSVHRMVGEAFIPNPENKPQINHKDGNPLNNHVDNLEWCTQSENMRHAYETGIRTTKDSTREKLSKARRGEGNGKSVLTKSKVLEIKKLLKEGNLYHSEIADRFNISQPLVTMISNGQRWAHVKLSDARPTLFPEQQRSRVYDE